MSKVAAIAASTLIVAGAFARGDMLPVILISAMFELGLQIRHRDDHREASYIARDHALILPGLDTKPGSDKVGPNQVAAETGQQTGSDHKPIENMSGIPKFKKNAV
jgi:hypothetical protein